MSSYFCSRQGSGGCWRLRGQGTIDIRSLISFPSPYSCSPLPATPFDPQMSSEISYSIGRSQKDEEASRSDAPILATDESDGAETRGRRISHNIRLAFARNLPRTYRVTSKVFLYLRGPRPKRDLDRACCLVTPLLFDLLNRSHFLNCCSGIYSPRSLPFIGVQLQSSNVVAPFGANMDSIHTFLHPSFSLRLVRRRLRHRSRILHSSAMVSNASRHIIQLHWYLLAS